MDAIHNAIAVQSTQERIAAAQAHRLAKEARQARSRKRSRRRAFQILRRPVVADHRA